MEIWQESLMKVLEILYIHPPLLILLTNDSPAHHNRLLANKWTDDFYIRHISQKWPTYISNEYYEEPPLRVKYFATQKCAVILAILYPADIENSSKLNQAVRVWRRNTGWSGKAALLIGIPEAPYGMTSNSVAQQIIEEVWKQGKVANIFVLIYKDNNVQLFTNNPYSPSCQVNVRKITIFEISTRNIISNVNKCRIKVASTELPPYVYTVNTSDPLSHGLEVKIFKMLAEMLNFTYEYVFSPPGEFAWAVTIDHKPAGLVGVLYRQEADVMFHGVRLTWGRFRLADALDSYHGGSYVWAAPLPEKTPEWKLIFLVFRPIIWTCIFLTLTAIALCITKLSDVDFSEAVISTVGLTVNIPLPFAIHSILLRFILALYMVYIVTISAAYQGALFDILSTGSTSSPIETAAEAFEHGYVATLFPTMAEDLKENDPNFYQYLVSEGLVNFTSDSLGSFRRIAKQHREIRLTIELLVQYENNLRFSSQSGQQFLRVLKERFSPYEPVFYLPKDHPLLPGVKTALRRLVETGWVIRLKDILLHEASRAGLSEMADERISGHKNSLRLRTVIGAFFLHIFIVSMSFLLFLIEIIWGRK